ncbi:hypothetical protein BA195_06815 [Tenacibaculum soleae]|uniref:Bacteriophage tail tape measure N-terminal domain-containing protein n=1 Tax=Tenacibaculum soleae TaxID=447689 RepID=A0A1B9Y3K7_9FLAO|nr:phage tail length tape measure family protein [Tenacibaculum soleae]OCK44383.1 hypothetical protein BA195_06815 [Tenacibaculum soleae]
MSLANVNIKFTADLKQFSDKIQNANRSIQKVGKRMQSVGKGLSVGLTAPLVAFSAVALKNWDKQEKAIAQVENGLKTTGGSVGFVSAELQKMASDLQNSSLFGDEDILQGVTTQLLTFTNIAGEQFKRTQLAALDLSAKLGTDLKSSSIQLGKALNDPVANLSALSRSGIQFSTEQKTVIKSLVETNRLADAQTIILDELAKQYGGSAEAAAKAGLGPFKQLSNTIGDLTEDFGKIIGEALLPFVASVKNIASGFQSLSPATKKFIVVLGGVAAAIGPMLVLAGTVLPAIVTGLGLVLSPVGLVVAALAGIGVVIYKYWEPIKQTLVDIANYFVDLYNESTVFRVAVEGVVLVFKNMWAAAKFVFTSIGDYLSALATDFSTKFKLIGAVMKAALTGNFKEIPKIFEQYKNDTANGMLSLAKDVKDNWGNLMVDVTDNVNTALDNIGKRGKITLSKNNVDVSGVVDKIKDISPVVVPTKLGGATGRKKATDSLAGQRGKDGRITQNLDLGLSKGISAEGEALDTSLNSVQDKLIDFSGQTSDILTGAANNFASNFGEIIGGLMSGTVSMGDIAGLLLQTIGDLATQLGEAAIAIGIGMIAIKAAFSNPFTAIAAGVALVAVGAIISGIASQFSGGGNDAGAFANGGVVGGNSPIGDKLFARVNSGEMILNTSQQRNLNNMISPASQMLEVVLGGQITADAGKLQFVLDKYNTKKQRRK